MESAEVRFQFGPPVRATFLAGIRHAQAGFLVTALGSAVLFLRFVPGEVGFGIALAFAIAGVAAAFGTIEGRPFDDWLPAMAHWGLIVVRRRRRWFSPAPGEGVQGPIEDPLQPEGPPTAGPPTGALPTSALPTSALPTEDGARAGSNGVGGHAAHRPGGRWRRGKPTPPPPVKDWQLIYTSVSGQQMGVLKDRRNKAWVAVIAVQGQSFMLLDEGDQVRRLSSWATVQASMARQGSPIARMQWLERTLTEVGDEMRSFFDERSQAAAGTQAHSSYAELLRSAQPATQQHETYLVLQITGARAARAIRNAGGGDKGAVAVLYRELDHLQRQLRESDLTVSGFLSGDQLAMLLRTQFDPEDALGLAARTSQGGEPLTSARGAWPLATEVSWGHYRTDGMYHITYWIAEWPRLGVRPSFLAPLLLMSSGVTRTVSVVAEPIPMAQAMRRVEHQQTARLSDDDIRSAAGYRQGARRRREAEALDRRENELADGHAENRYSGYVTVSGPNLEEVELAAATIEQVAYQCPVELRRLWGEQDTAFYCTMPLARGLS